MNEIQKTRTPDEWSKIIGPVTMENIENLVKITSEKIREDLCKVYEEPNTGGKRSVSVNYSVDVQWS